MKRFEEESKADDKVSHHSWKSEEMKEILKDKELTKKKILGELDGLDKMDRASHKGDFAITEGLLEGTPDDYGYFTLIHTGLEDEEKNMKHAEKLDLHTGKKKKFDFYKSGNFFAEYNRKQNQSREMYKSPLEILFRLVKDEKSGSHSLNIDNPEIVWRKKRETFRNATSKKMTNDPTNRTEKQEEEHLVMNTKNSRIRDMQLIQLEENKVKDALKLNWDYTLRKVKYEVDLIKFQINKYHKYLKNDPKQPVVITSEKPYHDLQRSSSKFLKNFQEFVDNKNIYSPNARTRLLQFSLEARTFLFDYMNGILQHYEKTVSTKRAANEKTLSFIMWKTKLAQLVGIWDLANSNGTEMKTTYKYLLLKKFLLIRAGGRQLGKDYINFREEKRSIFKKVSCLDPTKNERNTLIHPLGIMKETDRIRKVMEIIVVFLLLYSFVTVPVRLLMKIESNTMKLVEKFVDMYFYIDIMLYFRTSYKDKANEDRFDVRDIASRYFDTYFYIDFISTVPWYYFFYSFSFKDTIRIFTHILKIFRISKLMPILYKLEEMKAANLIRLMKVLLIFFLVAHWMSCILFFGTLDGLLYSVLSPRCYTSDFQHTKYTLTNECTYIFSFYNAAFSIPGQYTSYANATSHLAAFNEYLILLIQFLLGQFLSAYTFGGVTSIIQNLDQGSNFFMVKTDLLREHMFFYNIEKEVQNDVIVYYDYLWQRHKDIIYGKHHFNLLSKSLREKFEKFNLTGNEIYLHTFIKLGNEKLVGHILRELRKVILLPYEILYEEGAVVPGLFILTNGEIEFTSYRSENAGHSVHSVQFSEIVRELESHHKRDTENFDDVAERMTVIFPLVSIFIKTGRSYQRCSSTDFADLLHLPMASFEEIISSFPVEMHSLKHEVMQDVERKKLFENSVLFSTLSEHSARSVGKNYEKEFTTLTIWIPIPIPISQRKIATNYIESFVKKVKNQWREILVSSDMNICFNSMIVVGFMKQDNKDKSKNRQDDNEKNMLIQQGDALDVLKNLSRTVAILSEEFNSSAKIFFHKDD